MNQGRDPTPGGVKMRGQTRPPKLLGAIKLIHKHLPLFGQKRSDRKPTLSFYLLLENTLGFPDSSVGKESACNAGDPGSIPGSGRSVGEGIGYPLQFKSGISEGLLLIVSLFNPRHFYNRTLTLLVTSHKLPQ